MSGDDHPRKVLVLGASQSALADAARLLPAGTILENVVQKAIEAGAVDGGRKVGRVYACPLPEHGVVVVLNRTRSPLTSRKAWMPIAVRSSDLRAA